VANDNTSPGARRTPEPETIRKKGPQGSTCAFLAQTKDEIVYRWARRRWTERSIAAKFGIQREEVEAVLRERFAKPFERGPIVVIPARKAA